MIKNQIIYLKLFKVKLLKIKLSKIFILSNNKKIKLEKIAGRLRIKTIEINNNKIYNQEAEKNNKSKDAVFIGIL